MKETIMPNSAPQKTHLKDFCRDENIQRCIDQEEGCIQENNDLACNRLQELNTSGRNAAERVRKCKLVMWWLFAAEFKIISSGAEKGES